MFGNGQPATSAHTPVSRSIPIASIHNPGSALTRCCVVAPGRLSRVCSATPGGTFTHPTAVTYGRDSAPAASTSTSEDHSSYAGACADPYGKPDHGGSLGKAP